MEEKGRQDRRFDVEGQRAGRQREPIRSRGALNGATRQHPPFLNEHGVVIGDGDYASEQSPLEHWSQDVDPQLMAGEQWVHPTNDVGCDTEENREHREEEIRPQSYPFTHPTIDATYRKD